MKKGSRMSEESRKKVSLATKRRMQDPSERLRISNSLRGKKLSLATREKMSRTRKGNPQTNWFKKGEHVSIKTEFKKGTSPKRPFIKGREPWNKGKVYKKISGDKHWNWRGGTTKLIKTLRECFRFKEWRRKVFERDNYTCVFCGARCGEGVNVVLNVDHITPFSEILRLYDIEDYQNALETEALWNIDNGRTLCVACHRKTETYAVRTKEKHA